MPRALIETAKLSKRYRVGNETIGALSDLSISVSEGEFLAITGPSGSGKSTCLQLLGCLQTPSSGRYVLDGLDVSTLSYDELALVRNKKIGFVFQAFNLLSRANARENVELPLIYGETPRRERREMAEEALKSVGLESRMNHRPYQLSGGQMQRVAIARALVNKPKLLLADEPTGAVDSKTGAGIMALLSALNDAGNTVIVVTHDDQIARYARRVLTFRDGFMSFDQTR